MWPSRKLTVPPKALPTATTSRVAAELVAGTMAAALSAPVSAVVFGDRLRFPMFLGFALLVIWKHRDNIVRLKAGKEPRVGKKGLSES